LWIEAFIRSQKPLRGVVEEEEAEGWRRLGLEHLQAFFSSLPTTPPDESEGGLLTGLHPKSLETKRRDEVPKCMQLDSTAFNS
jgi:hypothetical protein